MNFDPSTMGMQWSLPGIPLLRGDPDFRNWKELLGVHLDWFNLEPFVKGTVAPPAETATDAEKNTYRMRRLMAYTKIRTSLSREVLDIIESNGWQEGNRDPKELYDFVCRTVPKISEEGWHHLLQELVKMDATKYDSLRAFVSRFNWLVNRLKTNDISFGEKALQSFLLAGLKQYDDHWAQMLIFQLQSGNLNYKTLLEMVTQKANEEHTIGLGLAAVTLNNKKTGDTQGTLCDDPRCGQYHPQQPAAPYHEFCKKHHFGGIDRCYKAHPELREQWLKEKAAKEAKELSAATLTQTQPSAGSSTPAETQSSTGSSDPGINPHANRAVFNFDSGVMDGINNKSSHFSGLALALTSVAVEFFEEPLSLVDHPVDQELPFYVPCTAGLESWDLGKHG